MLLRYLQLTNFLSHQSEELTFPSEGMFLLSGDSGIGKSSLIIDATAYSLFGPAAVTRAKRKEEMVNESNRGQEMKVKAIFQFANDSIVIERGISAAGQVFARVYSGDQSSSTTLAEGPKAVSRFIGGKLGGMNWQQFYAAFVARQNEISMLTSLRGAERKNLIHRMLGMRELEKASDLASQRLRRARAELDQLSASVGGFDPQQSQSQINQLQDRVDQYQRQLAAGQKSLANDQDDLKALNESLDALKEKVIAAQQLVALESKVELLDRDLSDAEESEDRHQSALSALAALPEIEARQRQSEQRVAELRQTYLRSQRRADKETALSSKQAALAVAERSPEELKAEIAAAQARIDQDRRALADRQAEVERLASSGECYVCERPFSDQHDHGVVVQDLEQKLFDSRQALQEAEAELESMSAALPEAERCFAAQQEVQRLQEAIAEIEAEGETESDLSSLEQRGRQLSEDSRQLQEQLAALRGQKRDLDPTITDRLAKLRAASSAARDELSEARQQAASNAEIADYQRLANEGQKLAEKIAGTQARLPELERSLESSEQDLERLKRDLEGREKELSDLEKIRSRTTTIERVSTYLKGFQQQLASEIRPALEQIGSEMLVTVSDGAYQKMIIDEDYEITVETAQGGQRRAAMLSGGEQIRANICLRLALTRLVSERTGVPVGFLIFDEPMPSQDPGHIQRIIDLLDSLRPFYQQQFLISHVGDLRSATELDYLIEFRQERPRATLSNA